MERKANNKVNMLITVDKFLDNNQPLISANPAIVEAHNRLKSYTSTIQTLNLKQSKDTTIETALKNKVKDTLITNVLKVAAGLGAHGTATADLRLQAIAKVSKTMLHDMRENDFNTKIQTIADAAKPIADQLAIWGVTQKDVDALDTQKEQFTTQTPIQRTVKVKAVQATGDLNKTVAEAVKYLSTTLDAFMLPFKTINPTFHGEYLHARKIIDTAATHKPAPDAPKA